MIGLHSRHTTRLKRLAKSGNVTHIVHTVGEFGNGSLTAAHAGFMARTIPECIRANSSVVAGEFTFW
jgi:hypothetical protein